MPEKRPGVDVGVFQLSCGTLGAFAHHEHDRVTVRNRSVVDVQNEGAGSRTMALTMTFNLLESAQKRWRKINPPDQARKLWQGTKFIDGLELTSSKPEINELPGKKVVQTKRKAA